MGEQCGRVRMRKFPFLALLRSQAKDVRNSGTSMVSAGDADVNALSVYRRLFLTVENKSGLTPA